MARLFAGLLLAVSLAAGCQQKVNVRIKARTADAGVATSTTAGPRP